MLCFGPGGPYQAPGHPIHAPFVGLGVMVVAYEMQETVGEEEADLVEQGPAPPPGLPRGRLERDHDVSQAMLARARIVAEREREHVSGAILATVL